VEFVHFDALIFCFFVAQFQDEASTGEAPTRGLRMAAGLVFQVVGTDVGGVNRFRFQLVASSKGF
jgi:hypothetical protein